jgi:hypothetical protein
LIGVEELGARAGREIDAISPGSLVRVLRASLDAISWFPFIGGSRTPEIRMRVRDFRNYFLDRSSFRTLHVLISSTGSDTI